MADGTKITIKCDACGKRFKAPAKLAGQKVKCPCGQVLKVPPEMDSGESISPEKAWYYLQGEERRGPVRKEELEERIDAGKVSLSSRVWRQGMEAWKIARDVDDLNVDVTSEVDDVGEAEEFGVDLSDASRDIVSEARKASEVDLSEEFPAGERADEGGKIMNEANVNTETSKTQQKSVKKPSEEIQMGRSEPSEAPRLPLARVLSIGLVIVGVIGLLGVLAVIVLERKGIGVGEITVPEIHVTAGALVALVCGTFIGLARSAVRVLWRIAERVEP